MSQLPQVAPTFSFVLPAFNEEGTLEEMARRIVSVGEKLGEPFEIVWVNDGSTDGTAQTLDRLADRDHRIKAVHLSRNFGHMAALTAGLDCSQASGAVICLDSDGQHPPELIPTLVQEWKDGADIVQAIRDASPHEGPLKRITSSLFYRIFRILTDVSVPEGGADFRLLDRQVVDALHDLPERVRFVRGLVHWLGFEKREVHYKAQSRLSGGTKYGALAMVRLALGGITSLSDRPLRIAFLCGLLVTLCAALYATYVLWCVATGVPLVRGWTSTLLVVLVLGGVQLLALGIASEYLARIYFETKHRPLYFIRKKRQRSVR
jgi:dolichol-phosphate mannosyltransferase